MSTKQVPSEVYPVLPKKIQVDNGGVIDREYVVEHWTGADWRLFYAFMRSRSAVPYREVRGVVTPIL